MSALRMLPHRFSAGIAALAMASLLPAAAALANPGFSFGEGDNAHNAACLKCHKDINRVGPDSQINPAAFGHTTHARIGCTTCHDTISANHPNGTKTTMSTGCKDCHADVALQYATSRHSLNAPDCNSCHNPHSVQKAGQVSAIELNASCIKCHNHNRISATHAQWLPQTDLHLGAITCVTCHTKTDAFVLSVYLSRRDDKGSLTRPNIADYGYLQEIAGDKEVQHLVDGNKDGYISIEELKSFNRKPANNNLYLKAVLTPDKTSHLLQTTDRSFNCTYCHASGPNKTQISRLVLPGKDGSYYQLAIESGGTIASLNAIPDFYMMGSTRNSLLNGLGALILAGGLVMPVGHGFVRYMTRKNRQKE